MNLFCHQRLSLGTLLGLSKRKQLELSHILFQLATSPSQKGDYSLPDNTGRDIHYLLVGNYVISFWPDHPACEVRIIEIDLV
jgi:hypothetical protein